MSKFWTRLAAALTIVWVAFWIFAIAIEWQNFKTLSFNEVGDFMAGAFGPVAFLWLVLGFFQQGEELKNNVEALKLQAEELRHSVEQQKEMVAVTRETLDHEIKALEQKRQDHNLSIMPRLEFHQANFTTLGSYQCEFMNMGGTAYQVTVTLYSKDGNFLGSEQTEHLAKGETIVVQCNSISRAKAVYSFKDEVSKFHQNEQDIFLSLV